MENFSDFKEQCGAHILLATNVLRCANNNNNLTKIGEKTKGNDDIVEKADAEQKIWNCSCIGVGNATAAGFVEDKGGGRLANTIEKDETEKKSENGAAACDTFENHYDLYAGAYDSDEAAAIDFHSNRNSRNNSTDNLSYASDQFYAKDLIFLEDDYDDEENGAEVDDISLNSDDCVYAYRGDGADFDFPLEAITGRPSGIAGNSMDDEMDFLEMDFDPDTLSEIENGGNSGSGSGALTATSTDALLLQRDISQLDGRHSSSSHIPVRNSDACAQQQQQRQLFSSPIDDLSTAAPMKVLSSQTLLGKNFGRMSLHLDQIKGSGEGNSPTTKPLGCESAFERINGLSGNGSVGLEANVSGISSSVGANHTTDLVIDYPTTSAHSLPNTLHAFGRESKEIVANKTSPTKVTGAKPKRLSTFSTSSSTSSKNSSKSRTSLRSVIGPSLYNSASFDERSVSCTEFRSAPPLSIADDTTALANSANVLAGNQFDPNDDSSCLDCLEKEFLASTIGKALEPNNCLKCRRKRYNFSKIDFQQKQQQQSQNQSLRCRSGSPSFFTDIASDSFYELSHESWVSGGLSSLSLLSSRRQDVPSLPIPVVSTAFKCDIISGEQLQKNLLTDKETVTISMADINEENLIGTLDQLQVAYNADLIKFYFESLRQTPSISSNLLNSNNSTKSKEFKDLKHFLLYESKKNCNHPKLKCLIEHVTKQQVEVHFKQDTNKSDVTMVNVSAVDILRHWSLNNNILSLQNLDNRFKKANVLGKIANLIRQTQTKRSSMRTQIEYIAIPQYYPDGFIVIKKKSQTF